MGILEYIIPQEWILRIIILFMWCLAGFVAYRCDKVREIAKKNLAMLERLENVKPLEDALLSNNVNTDQLFAKYEQDMGKSESTFALFEHLKTIYDAGAKSSRLDADLLVQNTVNKIFTGVGSLKTSISIFLIMGILGTLIGLAISIGGFNGANFIVTGQTGSTANELSTLFGNLRGAFAPSMWGVFFTILFVLGYTWIIQNDCIDKVEEKLTLNTIQYWLPKLYPTDFQRGDKSIVKLNRVIANADGINQGVTDLEKNLTSSNQALQHLQKVSQLINTASERFDKSTDKITKIRVLYDELQKSNENFNDAIHNLINSAVADREKAYQNYLMLVKNSQNETKQQNQQLQEQFKQLQINLQTKTDKAIARINEQTKVLADNTKVYFDQLTIVLEGQKDSFTKALATQYNSWQILLNNQAQKLDEIIASLKSYDRDLSVAGQQLTESVNANNQSVALNNQTVQNLQQLSQKLQNIEENLLQRQDEIIKAVQTPIVQELNKISQSISVGLANINDPLHKVVVDMQKMLDHNVKTLTAVVDPLKQMVEKLQSDQQQLVEDREQLSQNRDDIKELLINVQSTLAKVNENIGLMISMGATQNGVSPTIIEEYMQKLLENTQTRNIYSQEESKLPDADKKNGFLSVKNIPLIAIAVLLLISVVTQVVMVTKISTLEANQAAVNQVLMKGEMSSSNSTSGQ